MASKKPNPFKSQIAKGLLQSSEPTLPSPQGTHHPKSSALASHDANRDKCCIRCYRFTKIALTNTLKDAIPSLFDQRFQEGRSRRNILKICYEFSWSYWKSIFKSVKISRFSPKYSAISSFLSQVCCLVTPTESFVLKIFSKYFGGIALLEIVGNGGAVHAKINTSG